MPAINKVVEYGHAAAAQSGPMIPAKFGLAAGLENSAHHTAELTARNRTAAYYGPAHIHVLQLAVYGIDAVVFLSIVIAHFGKQKSQTAVRIAAARVDITARGFGADEIRQVLRVLHCVLF